MEAYTAAVEAHLGGVKAHPCVLEADHEAMKARSRVFEAQLELRGQEPRRLTLKPLRSPWRPGGSLWRLTL
jgi:hypothetical protein